MLAKSPSTNEGVWCQNQLGKRVEGSGGGTRDEWVHVGQEQKQEGGRNSPTTCGRGWGRWGRCVFKKNWKKLLGCVRRGNDEMKKYRGREEPWDRTRETVRARGKTYGFKGTGKRGHGIKKDRRRGGGSLTRWGAGELGGKVKKHVCLTVMCGGGRKRNTQCW